MKSRIVLASSIIILITVINGCYLPMESRTTATTNVARENVQVERDYNVDDLNSYGQWINTPEYGHVWRPSTSVDWQPYYDGHWAYDGYDWVWVSNEPYGQIVYHYGNWVYSDYNGWVWIPAYDKWSPARVQWRRNGDVVCWAPMPAKGARLAEPWETNNRGWSIVRTEDFNRENVNARRIRNISSPGAFSRDQIERTAPDVKVIERRTNQTVPVVRIDRGVSRNGNAVPSTNTRQPDINRTPAVREVTKERVPDVKPAVRDAAPVTRPAIRDAAPAAKDNTPAVRQVEREKAPEQKPAVRDVTPVTRPAGNNKIVPTDRSNARTTAPVLHDSVKRGAKLNSRLRPKDTAPRTVAPAKPDVKTNPTDREKKVDAPEKKADRQDREK
jgi:hypothetical protein